MVVWLLTMRAGQTQDTWCADRTRMSFVLALEVSGRFKEHWEGLARPIRTLQFSSAPCEAPPPLPSTCVTEGHTGFQKWVRDKRQTRCINFCLHWGKKLGSLALTDALEHQTSRHLSAFATDAMCKHTHTHTKTQRWTETTFNSDQKFWSHNQTD